MSSAISFTIPLSAAPEVHFIKAGQQPPVGHCSGEAAKPEAVSGNLCVFAEEEENDEEYLISGILHSHYFLDSSASGSVVAVQSTKAEPVIAEGTWAVTG
jgi:hypothetical protein